jgi:hypothetical protein
VNAPAVFFGASVAGVSELIGLLTMALDGLTSERFPSRTFVSLRSSQRDTVLGDGLSKVPQLEFAVQLAKVAYYSSAPAAQALGYPGANAGYRDDADFSFDRPMAKPLQVIVDHGGNPV